MCLLNYSSNKRTFFFNFEFIEIFHTYHENNKLSFLMLPGIHRLESGKEIYLP